MTMSKLFVSLAAAALAVAGCQSSPTKTTAEKQTDAKKAAVAGTPTKTGAVSSTNPEVADLERLAKAAAEGKPVDAPSTPGAAALPPTQYDKPGFATKVIKGRLWVFKSPSPELTEFATKGDLAKSVTRIGVGPEGMTVRAPDGAVIDAYLAAGPKSAAPAAPGASAFVTKPVKGRLWVFKAGSPELVEFEKHGELAKSVTRVGAGPGGVTLRAPDAATIDAFLASAQ